MNRRVSTSYIRYEPEFDAYVWVQEVIPVDPVAHGLHWRWRDWAVAGAAHRSCGLVPLRV